MVDYIVFMIIILYGKEVLLSGRGHSLQNSRIFLFLTLRKGVLKKVFLCLTFQRVAVREDNTKLNRPVVLLNIKQFHMTTFICFTKLFTSWYLLL